MYSSYISKKERERKQKKKKQITKKTIEHSSPVIAYSI